MENPKLSLEETLLPALVQCFGIILIGYILGKAKILSQTQAQGLSTFVQYLSLPALIFVTVSTIPFTQIKWEFIASVFVAKTCVFLFVAVISMLLTHPHDMGKAGIFAISATQSNDFALGYPLFVALYQNTHPEYPMYLYIIAPIQLLILNTVGFFFLEVQKHTQSNIKNGNYLYHILKGTLQNPVVIMTIAGLIWNVSYGQKILPIFDNILKAFSSAFPATALLLVGYTMTVSNQKSCSRMSLSVILLIISKNLILPLILQKLSGILLQKSSETEVQSFSSFGFLYGTIPTAPSVYVFATQYNTAIDVITKTVIGSTLLSAPLMFASASVISLAQVGIENAAFYLTLTIGYLSCINICGCIWLLLLFLMGKRWKSISFGITFYLVLTQLIMAIGGILIFIPTEDYSALFCIQYILSTGSIYATRMCTFLLAILLLIIRVRSLCFILQIKRQINAVSLLICFILPYVLAASLLVNKNKDLDGPNFQLGFVQIVTTFVLTLLCLVGTIICVIMQQVYLRRNTNKLNQELNTATSQNPLVDDCLNSLPKTCDGQQATTSKRNCRDIEDIGRSFNYGNCLECEDSTLNDISDKVCDSRYQCSTAKRIQCSTEVSRYINENNQIGTGLIDDEYFCKHIILLIILGVAMTLSLFVCIWKLMMEAINGIFIELEFLDVIVNYSLGVVYFIIFGLDYNLIQLICAKFKFVRNRNNLQNTNTKDICNEFLVHHYENCKEDIGQNRIINDVEYSYIFAASDLASWLLEMGVSNTNEEAELYIECLLKAQIIEELEERDGSLHDIHLFQFSNPNFSINV